jgi:hypothetical protein
MKAITAKNENELKRKELIDSYNRGQLVGKKLSITMTKEE